MATGKSKNKEAYELIIIGSGSASFAGAIRAAELGKRVAMIERGTLGGTCVNTGCIPSKTLIRAAEARQRAEHPPFRGIHPKGAEVDFSAVIREKDMLVDSLRQAKYRDVLRSYASIDLIAGEASFISGHAVKMGEQILRGEYFLVATGASPFVPPIPGLDTVQYLTSTTAFALKKLPSSMIIIGGRYIALEVAQMFQRLGCRVTVLQRSERILPAEDPDLTEALQGYLEGEGLTVLTGVSLSRVSQSESFQVAFVRNGEKHSLNAEQLVVAAGRTPNTAGLNLAEIGVALDQDGAVSADEYCRTTLPHVYGAGDVIGGPAFVYTAAYEGKLAVDNAFGGTGRKRDYSVVPYVIFTDPQVARVGLNELEARRQGIEVDIAKLSLDHVPRCLAARDTRGFIKLLREKGTDRLLGASILAPEGGELLMEVAMTMQYKIPLSEIAAMFHPYLTLGEGVKLAAQMFNKDVQKLSCCAV